VRALRRHDLLGPLLVVLVVYLGALGVQLHRYDGDPTGFVQFGSEAGPSIEPPLRKADSLSREERAPPHDADTT
jgi:hypothetical protein